MQSLIYIYICYPSHKIYIYTHLYSYKDCVYVYIYMLKFDIHILLHVFQQMNDLCWLWLFICVSIYIYISCVDLGFFWSQHITFSHFPIDSATSRLEKKQNDKQTVHHLQTPYQENKNPSLRIREKTCISGPKSM